MGYCQSLPSLEGHSIIKRISGNLKSVPAWLWGLLYLFPCETIILSLDGKLPTLWLA